MAKKKGTRGDATPSNSTGTAVHGKDAGHVEGGHHFVGQHGRQVRRHIRPQLQRMQKQQRTSNTKILIILYNQLHATATAPPTKAIIQDACGFVYARMYVCMSACMYKYKASVEDDVTWQILAFGTPAVGDPSPHARTTLQAVSAVQEIVC